MNPQLDPLPVGRPPQLRGGSHPWLPVNAASLPRVQLRARILSRPPELGGLAPAPVGRPRRGRRAASESHQNRVLILGLGNDYRRDDAVGLVVVRQLRGRVPAGVVVLEQSGEAAALLEAWKGYSIVFLVDAVCSGASPGTIHRLDAQAAPLPRRLFQCSTHAFSLPEAVELARALHQLPPRLRLYGIEGKDFSAGVGLSAEVEPTAAAIAEEILGSVFNAEAQRRKAQGDRHKEAREEQKNKTRGLP